jgi:hypothetical protein
MGSVLIPDAVLLTELGLSPEQARSEGMSVGHDWRGDACVSTADAAAWYLPRREAVARDVARLDREQNARREHEYAALPAQAAIGFWDSPEAKRYREAVDKAARRRTAVGEVF